MRAFSAVVLVAGLVFLTACGGSGTPAGIPITITLSAGAASLNPGQSTTITATVANDSSNKGVSWSVSPSGFGTLSNPTSTSVTYTAPASVSTTTTVTITATSVASPTVTAIVQIGVQTSSISIALTPAAPQTINQGASLPVTAKLTNDTSNKGVTWSISPQVGSLSGPTSTTVTYQAPSSVSSNTLVTLTATSVADSAATAMLEITVFPSGAGPNVAALTVDAGPAPTTNAAANSVYVSVAICVPSTQTCQTVDHILVDTGSSGLRILESAIPGLPLPTLSDSSGGTIDNCVQFLDTSYLWGPVQQADIRISGEVASAVYIQTISSSNTGIPTACTNGGTINENTPQLLEANGILGVGPEPTDCTAQGPVNLCDGSVQSPLPAYFDCPSSGCVSTDTQITIVASQQVTNPVTLFGSDSNNGVILQLPAVTSTAATVSGSLIFGINTAAGNNNLGTATVFPLSNDNFITLFEGQTLTASFIDSGSNALFFPSSITVCAVNSSFYCPASLSAQSATNEGASGTPTSLVDFNVDNADNLFNNNPGDAVFATLAGPQGTANTCTSQGTGSCTFDWGLPFFYGNTVFTAIDGATVSNVGTGPFWAYTKP